MQWHHVVKLSWTSLQQTTLGIGAQNDEAISKIRKIRHILHIPELEAIA
jgi:hypothetical protein